MSLEVLYQREFSLVRYVGEPNFILLTAILMLSVSALQIPFLLLYYYSPINSVIKLLSINLALKLCIKRSDWTKFFISSNSTLSSIIVN